MTCQDCKYFNPNIHLKPEWVNQGLCEKRLTNGYAEYPSFDCEICGMFQPTHESVETALDALDIISKIKAEIEQEIDKEYTEDLCANQYIRAGYLGALCIIKKYTESDNDT